MESIIRRIASVLVLDALRHARCADHYRHEHWMCGAPECKGVVFAAEHELRTHAAREHGDAMSRAERRQAMTIPITLQASRPPDQALPPDLVGEGCSSASLPLPQDASLCCMWQCIRV